MMNLFIYSKKIINLETYDKKRGACIDTPFFTGPENLMKPEFLVTFRTGTVLRSN
jgi:hypothetical protein